MITKDKTGLEDRFDDVNNKIKKTIDKKMISLNKSWKNNKKDYIATAIGTGLVILGAYEAIDAFSQAMNGSEYSSNIKPVLGAISFLTGWGFTSYGLNKINNYKSNK